MTHLPSIARPLAISGINTLGTVPVVVMRISGRGRGFSRSDHRVAFFALTARAATRTNTQTTLSQGIKGPLYINSV